MLIALRIATNEGAFHVIDCRNYRSQEYRKYYL